MRPGEGQRVEVALDGTEATVGSTMRAAIRPERVRILGAGAAAGAPLGPGSRLGGVVGAVDYIGSLTTYRVDTDVGAIAVQEANDSPASDFEVGDRVLLEWAPDAAFMLPESPAGSPPAG
jgi:ABC-type Fe3+/spermidine/putrescine transport system ATPase subunit